MMIERSSVDENVLETYRRSRRWLLSIGVLHGGLVIAVIVLLYRLNLSAGVPDLPSTTRMIIVNSALVGFVGSLLYFSRKVYVYLITNKFGRVLEDRRCGQTESDWNSHEYKTAILGYCMYLTARPIAGLMIGPLLMMAIQGGLLTMAARETGSEIAMSRVGMYLVYFVSFVGGYSCSDMFDCLSQLGSKLRGKLKLR
jgi:hypothetical protein